MEGKGASRLWVRRRRAGAGNWQRDRAAHSRNSPAPPLASNPPAPLVGPHRPRRGHHAGTSDSSGRKGTPNRKEIDISLIAAPLARLALGPQPGLRNQEKSLGRPETRAGDSHLQSRVGAPGPCPRFPTVAHRPQSGATCLPRAHLTSAAPGRAWREEGNQGQKQGLGVFLGFLFISTGYSCPGDDKSLTVGSKSTTGIEPVIQGE